MDWLVLLPPLIAIGAALLTRQVFISLFVGLWVGTTMLAGGNPLQGLRELLDQMVAVFGSAGNARVIIFCILVGGLIALVQASGGVRGFVRWMQSRGLGNSRRGAELMAWFVGIVIFVESNITSLVVGAVGRPFFDRLRLPREKLAFYCDATSAPVCMSIPLNGWGAYVLGLLAAQNITANAVQLLASSLLFNFFSLFAIVFALIVALTGWGFGPMKRAEERAADTGQLIREGGQPLVADEVTSIEPENDASPRAFDLLVPLITMVGMIFFGLWATGEGDITAGSGSTAVLWAVSSAIAVAIVLYALPRKDTDGASLIPISRSVDLTLKGCSGLVSVTVLIVFAFALGQVSRALEMGPYLAGVVEQGGPGWWIPALVFAVGGFVSFTLGSSWTSFAILIPIAMPLAEGLSLSAPLMLGAVLSGGVFGDYSSPLSDTSIISSMAAASDHIDHVNTQLPYALLLAGLSFAAFLVAGLVA